VKRETIWPMATQLSRQAGVREMMDRGGLAMESEAANKAPRGMVIALQIGVAAFSLLLVQCGKKAETSNLPEVPADLAGELKPVEGTHYYLIQAAKKPAIKSGATRAANPAGGSSSGGKILKKACAGTTVYAMDAIYPVLICHPLLDDLRPPNGGALSREEMRVSPKAWAPEGKSKYQLTRPGLGLLVCADARMPVGAQLTETTSCEDGSNQYIVYKLDLNGLITLNWVGDVNARPEGLILVEPGLVVGQNLFPCSGTSTANSACPTSGGGVTPAVAKSPR
jgi:hypothetical protein